MTLDGTVRPLSLLEGTTSRKSSVPGLSHTILTHQLAPGRGGWARLLSFEDFSLCSTLRPHPQPKPPYHIGAQSHPRFLLQALRTSWSATTPTGPSTGKAMEAVSQMPSTTSCAPTSSTALPTSATTRLTHGSGMT